MACPKLFSGLCRSSVRQTASLPKGHLLSPAMVYATKSGFSPYFDESTNVDELFRNWCLRHGKWYSSAEEKQNIREAFGYNVAYLLSINEMQPPFLHAWAPWMDTPANKMFGCQANFDELDTPECVNYTSVRGHGGYISFRKRNLREQRSLRKCDNYKRSPVAIEFAKIWPVMPAYACPLQCKDLHKERGALYY